MSLPTDAKKRKEIPLFSGFVSYFPDTMAAVAQLSVIANEQHNPGQPLHWSKHKSTDHADSCQRHLSEIGPNWTNRDTDGVLHAVKAAWRANAIVQTLADKGVDVLAITPPYKVVPPEEEAAIDKAVGLPSEEFRLKD